jgi:hypothetical protein
MGGFLHLRLPALCSGLGQILVAHLQLGAKTPGFAAQQLDLPLETLLLRCKRLE